VPTYQYACSECGHQLEVVQSFSDAALTECPTCGGKLRKQFSAVGIVFKGSGFYRTDSRSTSSASTGSNGTAKESAGTSTEKSAEKVAGAGTKPATSSDKSTSSKDSGSKSTVSTSS
jgi:putative FmdB family regulatory protein